MGCIPVAVIGAGSRDRKLPFLNVIRRLGQVWTLPAFRAVVFVVCSGIPFIPFTAGNFRQVGKGIIDIRPCEDELPAVIDASFDFQADKKRCGSSPGFFGCQIRPQRFPVIAQYQRKAAVFRGRLGIHLF